MQLTNLASLQLVLWNILKKYKQDPDSVFRKTGLNPSLMHQSGKRYPIRKTDELWLEAGRRISDPCFGLSAADCWHPSYLGTLGYAMLVSTSLRIALERLIRFHRVVSDVHFAKLSDDTAKGTLSFTLTDRDNDIFFHPLEDAVIALFMSILRMNYHQELAPVAVTFRHGCPECSSRYYEFFKSPVHFDAPVTSLTLSLDVVDMTLPGGNEELAAVNEQLMTRYLDTLDDDGLITKIKRIIVEHLPSGDATVETAAAQLYISTRTLQRQLHQEGTTFFTLLNETRQELASQYVRDKNMDLTEVAFLLGFAELSTFSRSFKRWTGKSPIQYRKAA
jgi:AraC-like DNA-binding protein